VKLAVLLVFSLCTAVPALAQVKITQTPEQIAVEIDGKPFTVVNRSFPAGQLPRETTDHPAPRRPVLRPWGRERPTDRRLTRTRVREYIRQRRKISPLVRRRRQSRDLE
jgi:hypothetical protein